MIVRMMKYTLVVLARERERFLTQLQELGLVDVTVGAWEPTTGERETMSMVERYGRAIESLRSVDKSVAYSSGAEAFMAYESARSGLAEAQTERARIEKLLVDLEPLGEFDPEQIREVERHGVDLFELAGIERVELPERGPEEMRAELEGLRMAIVDHNKTLSRAAASIPLMEREQARLKDELHLQKVAKSGAEEAEGQLVVLEAWARERQSAQVEELLDRSAVLYLKSRPTPEDEVPVELQNGGFAGPFEFIGNLYSKPKYGSMDLTRWFAPFFMLFFGMCMGDAGYGALLFLGGLFVTLKLPKMRQIGRLTMMCGGAAIVVGFIMGGMFGTAMAEWPIFRSIKNVFVDSNTMFYAAIAIGIFHVLFAMVLNIVTTIRAFGLKYALASIGWFVVLVSAIAGYLLGALESVPVLSAIGVGVFLMLFFNSPGKNPLVNFGAGLWATFNRLTGLLGDTLSYIRLFAIGLAGGILAQVFNTIAFSTGEVPVIGPVLTLIILLVGHALNLFLSTLSAIVHPLRLTFVEFFNNAGFESTERIFTPFKQTK